MTNGTTRTTTNGEPSNGIRTVTSTVLLPQTRPLPQPTTTTTVLTARDRLPSATARPPVATVAMATAMAPATVLATVPDTAWSTLPPLPVLLPPLVRTTTTSGPSRLTVRTPTLDGASLTTSSPLSLMMMSYTQERSRLTTTSGHRSSIGNPSMTNRLATRLLPPRHNSPLSNRPPTFPPTTTDTATDGEHHAVFEIMCISFLLTELLTLWLVAEIMFQKLL